MTDIHANNSIPTTLEQALRHFGTVENKFTPVLLISAVSESDATVKMVKKMYRKLALLIHPNQAGSDERWECDHAMRVLSRSLDHFMSQMECEDVPCSLENEQSHGVDSSLLFDIEQVEYLTRCCKMDGFNEQQRRSRQMETDVPLNAERKEREEREREMAEKKEKEERDRAAKIAAGRKVEVQRQAARKETIEPFGKEEGTPLQEEREKQNEDKMGGEEEDRSSNETGKAKQGEEATVNDEDEWRKFLFDKSDVDSNLVDTDADGSDEIGFSSCLEEDDLAEESDTHTQEGMDFSQNIAMVHPAILSSPTSDMPDRLDGADSSNTANKCREQQRRSKKKTMERFRAQVMMEEVSD